MRTESAGNGGESWAHTIDTQAPDIFRQAMQQAAIGMALLEPEGTILAANKALCAFFGYEESALLGMTVQALTHPLDMRADIDLVERLGAGLVDSYRIRKRYIHASGEVITGLLIVGGIRDSAGKLKTLTAQIIDVTPEAHLEENLRLLTENGTDVIARINNDGTLGWLSPSVTRATGWRTDQLVDAPFVGLVHQDDRAAVSRGQQRLCEGESVDFDLRLMHADGTFSWFATHMDPVRSPDGKMTGRIATWRAMDAEMEARILARQRELEFRTLAENASDVVIKIGQDGRITWVSPSAVTALGWDPHNVVGTMPVEFLHPHDVEDLIEQIQQLTPNGPSLHRARRIMAADGTYHWFSIKASLAVDSAGRPAGRVLGLRDIEDEVRARAALESSEQVFRTAMESAPGGMAVLSLDREFRQVNKALCAMLGRPGDWLTGHRIDDILHPDDHAIDQVLRREVQAGMQRSGVKECRLLRADGTVVWVEHAVGLVRDEAGAPVAYVSQFVDISEARESRRELEFLAGHDPLTRLSNRRSLVERMGTALEQLPRTGTRIGVVFLDLDGLKTVNDTYGHAAGDELIVQVAERIRRSVRSDDIVARLGGDEFVVVLIRVHDLGEASAVAGKIRAVMTQPIGLAQGQVVVTASAGVTLAEAGEAPDDAIARADSLLYQAKSAGGNRAIAL